METHVNSKGQIIIPVTLRRKYEIMGGTRIVVSDNGDAIVLTPMTEQYFKKLQGSLKGEGALKVLVTERRKEKSR